MTVVVVARDGERPFRERRRNRILEAAAALFGEMPFAEVQVDDIARRAGIGKATLYRYFPSKEALYLQVFETALARLEAELAAIGTAAGSARQQLALMLERLTAALEQTRTLGLLDEERPGKAGNWRALYRARRRAILAALRAVIVAGCDAGEFSPVDLDVTPALLIGMIRGGLASAPQASPDRVASAAIALVLEARLAARPP